MRRKLRFSEPIMSERDLEEEVVQRYTHRANRNLDDIPQAKFEDILQREAQRQGVDISKSLIDSIIKDEKREIDKAVKDVRSTYGYSVSQIAVNDFYKRYYNVMNRRFKDASYKLSGVRFSRVDAAFRRQFDDFIFRLEAMISRLPNARILQLELNRIKSWAAKDMDYGLTTLEKFARLHYPDFREWSLDYAGTLRNGINNLINSYR